MLTLLIINNLWGDTLCTRTKGNMLWEHHRNLLPCFYNRFFTIAKLIWMIFYREENQKGVFFIIFFFIFLVQKIQGDTSWVKFPDTKRPLKSGLRDHKKQVSWQQPLAISSWVCFVVIQTEKVTGSRTIPLIFTRKTGRSGNVLHHCFPCRKYIRTQCRQMWGRSLHYSGEPSMSEVVIIRASAEESQRNKWILIKI